MKAWLVISNLRLVRTWAFRGGPLRRLVTSYRRWNEIQAFEGEILCGHGTLTDMSVMVPKSWRDQILGDSERTNIT
ncbi:hypothetical protein BJ508DRAFT_132042 [Ascobolus immersus RN42]|uniref:Uncharacterized protein n=1 Tax=Ascobolus immersus RN42 TaxID=1160509 RepID=A0A3N4I255_ASCIM|nr:hypothetical protein BJ508DRAFT_132042 [Ascobolus immersus RN42]